MKDERRKWWILLGTGVSVTILGIDYTIVFMALAKLQHTFSARLDQLQWVVMGMGVASTATLTMMGRLADRYGRRRLLYVGLFGFFLFSIGAGLSQTMGQLIFCRFLLGVFGAAIYPAGLALVAHAFPREQRGRALGLFGGFWGIGVAMGPFLGGLILEITTWRWIFFINPFFITISFLICLISVRASKGKESPPIDWVGAFLLLGALLALTSAVTEGPVLGWQSGWIITGFIVAAILGIFFVLKERKSFYPTFPLSLLVNKGFILGILLFICTSAASWLIAFFVPLYLQNVLDYSPIISAFIFLSMTGMVLIGAPTSGHLLDKRGPRLILTLVFIFLCVSYILQLFIGTVGPIWLVILAFIFFGCAWGVGNGTATPLALHYSNRVEDTALIGAGLGTVLRFCGVLLVAIGGIIFHYTEKLSFSGWTQQYAIELTQRQKEEVKVLLSNTSDALKALAPFGDKAQKILQGFREAFVSGYHAIIWSLLGLTLLLFIGIVFVVRFIQAQKI